jgi:hypothetical protein
MLESHSLTARLSPLKKSRLMIYPPNLPAVSDVLGTVVVVGDGAVGLLGVLSTKHIRSHH